MGTSLSQRTAKLDREIRERSALIGINRAMSDNPGSGGLFRTIAEAVHGVLSFDRMSIILSRPEKGDLIFYAFESNKGEPYWYPGAVFPRAGTVPGWVIEHKRSFVGSSLEDLSLFPISLDVVSREGMKSIYALPLLPKERPVGCLVFYAKDRGHFNPESPPNLELITSAVAVAVDHRLAYDEISQLKNQLSLGIVYNQKESSTGYNSEKIVGKSQAIKEVLKYARIAASTDCSALLLGETGTGKGVIAREIHHLSRRTKKLLVKVNCSALPPGLIESELFGHEKGAFTGAISRKIGRFELADGGSIFLDEIGDLSHEVQSKLLRVLDDHKFERVGGTQTVKVDVRVIAATNRNLLKEMEQGNFRTDLYYRLNVFPIHLPPLRERTEDIPLLTDYFLQKYTIRNHKKIEKVSQETMGRLIAYSWPGNIRELENVIERAVLLSGGDVLEIEDGILPTSNRLIQADPARMIKILDNKAVQENEFECLLGALRQANGNHSKAARLLGISRTTLWRRFKASSVSLETSETENSTVKQPTPKQILEITSP